jgi:RimJ/RimL family protein N-acetyltransferase
MHPLVRLALPATVVQCGVGTVTEIFAMTITTPSLFLVSKTKQEALHGLAQMSVEERRQVSPEWLRLLDHSLPSDPWIHGFVIVLRDGGKRIGQCGFAGPPGSDGIVEIAYGVDAEYRAKGYATEAAMGLVQFALEDPRVRAVRAHTLPEENASTRVLRKCGFVQIGESIDHEVGAVWEWERRPSE